MPDRLVGPTVFGEISPALDRLRESVGPEVQALVRDHFVRERAAKQLSEAERVGQEVGAIGGVLKKGSLTFLDQRRWNNIAIGLSKLGLDNATIRTAVVAADESVLTPSAVELLLPCLPTADDIEAIAPYDGDPELLATVERFFWEVHAVPLFTSRVHALHAKQASGAQAAPALGFRGRLHTAASASTSDPDTPCRLRSRSRCSRASAAPAARSCSRPDLRSCSVCSSSSATR